MISRKKATIFFVLVLILVITTQASNLSFFGQEKLLGVSTKVTLLNTSHKVKFFDERTFYEGVSSSKNAQPFNCQISGGIIPHDYFVSYMIAQFFKRLSFQYPKTIILIGPNHFEKGDFKVLTSFYNWDTPFGQVMPDSLTTKALINQGLVKVDEETLPNDHAVSGLMPFIKYYLPNTKVVPLLLKSSLTKDESKILASALSSLATKDVVVLSAVDFSHYLTSKEAQEKDKTTIEVIYSFDYKRLYLFDNNYLDSPPSVGVLLMIMQEKSTTNTDLLYHTDLGKLQGNNNIPITSYFALTFF